MDGIVICILPIDQEIHVVVIPGGSHYYLAGYRVVKLTQRVVVHDPAPNRGQIGGIPVTPPCRQW